MFVYQRENTHKSLLTSFQSEIKNQATRQDGANRGVVANQARRIYTRDGFPRVFWRGHGGGGSLEQIHGWAVPSPETGMQRVQETTAPSLS